jgi:hypothetical protein
LPRTSLIWNPARAEVSVTMVITTTGTSALPLPLWRTAASTSSPLWSGNSRSSVMAS